MKFFTTLCLIFMTLLASATRVDVKTARTVAHNFYLVSQENKQQQPLKSEAFLYQAFTYDTDTTVYLFKIKNLLNGKYLGFILTPADDIAIPILAFSFKNEIDSDNIPPALNDIINSYNEQIYFAISQNLSQTLEITNQWNRLTNDDYCFSPGNTAAVEPLVQSEWGQSAYFNQYCPYESQCSGSSYNYHVPVGCVATAQAQVMRYWSYPSTGNGSHTYLPQDHPEYGYQSANFGATNYNWSSMPLIPSNADADVLTIMYHAGVSVDMNYGPCDVGSGASTSAVADALVNYFGYSSQAVYNYKSNYSTSTWEQMLRNELDNGRPMVYRGRTSNNEGHAFVCDGYMYTNYFHFNFGWRGSGDCYCYLSAIIPEGSSYNFSYDQGAVMGIEPGGGDVDLEFSQYVIDDDASGGSIGDGDGQCEPGEEIELSVELYNNGSADAHNVEGVLSTTDADITITDDYQSWGTVPSGDYDITTDFDFSISADCPDKDVLFTLEISADEGSWTETFIIHIFGSNPVNVNLVFSQYEIDDDNSGSSSGDGDAQCEPGEIIELNVELFNNGDQTAHNVVGTLTTDDPDISITDDYQSWGTISAGSYDWTSDFDFEVSADCPDKDVLFNLSVTCDEGNFELHFVIHIYGELPVVCVECPAYDFDISCLPVWQISNSSIESNGCKLYRINTLNGKDYIFKTGCDNGASADFDSYLQLMDGNCNVLTFDDDACEEFRSKLEWTSTLPDNTFVYIRISGYDDNDYGTYSIAYRINEVPVANFTGDPQSGEIPLNVFFTDQSLNSPTNWYWEFGDGNTSTLQNPNHQYTNAGTYTVSLTVSNSNGADSEIKSNYINAEWPENIPIAAFIAHPVSGYGPLYVTFTDQSLNNPTSWYWEFGDGYTSTQQNPAHNYINSGYYTVTLTVSNAYGSDNETIENYIHVLAPANPPVANFIANPAYGVAPLSVAFTDLSTNNPDSWSWNFGDGGVSYSQNPLHEFNTAGTFTITLTVANETGSDTETKSGYIIIGNQSDLPIADFTANPTYGSKPLSVQFNNTSSNGTSWLWSFGDGATSVIKNPLHVYSSTGTYTVTLTAINQYGSNIKSRSNYINVLDGNLPIADFEGNPQSGSLPLAVQFTDKSLYADNWHWNFGDGNESSTQNPLYTYSIAGKYSVTLTVSNQYGENTKSISNYITVNSIERPTADFTADVRQGASPLTVTFTNLSKNASQWVWDFGDGNNSSQTNPVHTYSSTGSYTVVLTATGAGGEDVETKMNYISVTEFGADCDSLHFPLPIPLVLHHLNEGQTGFIAGNNSYNDKAIAEYFSNVPQNLLINGLIFDFGYAVLNPSGDEVLSAVIWKANSQNNRPGTFKASVNLSLSDIVQDVAGYSFTVVDFNDPIQPGGNFYAGLILPVLQGDTVALKSTISEAVAENTTWILDVNNNWQSAEELYSVSGGSQFLISSAIYPRVCSVYSIEDDEMFEFAFWPNPATDYINLISPEVLKRECVFEIVDVTGKCVHSGILLPARVNMISLKNILPGIYILKLNGAGFSQGYKLIKLSRE